MTERNFDRYTTETGLSHNAITGITQDSTGYIWIATSSGLNRFNGTRFVQFRSTDDTLSVAAEELLGLSWLDKSRLAAFTSGLHVVDTRTGKTRNVYIPYHQKKFQYKLNMIVNARGDEVGNLFIITRTGFYHFDKNYQLVFRYDDYKDEDIPLAHVIFGREILELDDRRLLISAVNGVFVYDKQTREFRKMTEKDSPVMAGVLSTHSFYRFFQLKRGEFLLMKPESDSLFYFNTLKNRKVVSFLPFKPDRMEFHWRTRAFFVNDTSLYVTGHTQGFYKARFYPETGKIDFSPELHFRQFLCVDVFVDRDDRLWVATTKGLYKENPMRSHVELTSIPQSLQDSFPSIRVGALYSSDDKVYAGTRAEGGLLLFDKKTFSFIEQIRLKIVNKYYGNNIYSIAEKDKNSLLLGRNGKLVSFNMTNNKESYLVPPGWPEGSWVYDVAKDSKGNIWISSDKIYKYNPSTNTFKAIPSHPRLLSFPFGIEEDRNGHIWFAGHGLARYNTITDSIDLYLDSFPYIKMSDRQVNALAIDKNNTLWFNSYNNGLIAYDIDKKTFRHFTRGDGLPDNNVSSLAIVKDRLWIAGFTGMACMDLETSQIVSFGKEDGFPDLPVVNGSRFYYDEKANLLYLGFSTVVVRFDPDVLLQRKAPPHLFIENLVIGGRQSFLPDSSIETSWRDNQVSLTIGSINFADGASQRFAYRIIKERCTPWIQIGNQASFSISSLLPGEYRVQVKAYSPN
ncbi:MAG TPA: two-component regulator propeller domain-containing protein, partial [Chitinophagaceae bacterium]